MNDDPKIHKLDDVRPDPTADFLSATDEHLDMVPGIARVISAEYVAIVERGVPPMAAAILIGNRWRQA